MPAASRRGGGGLELEVDTREFAELLTDVKRFEPLLARGLRRNIRTAAGRAARASRDEIRRAPARGPKHTGLRNNIARGIKVQIATGIRGKRVGVFIKATSSGLPEEQAALVRKYNRETWRHPVWGHPKVWVSQRGHPYFDKPIEAHESDVRKAVDLSLTAAADALGRGRKGRL